MKAGARAPTPSACSACPDQRSSSVARCMISIADWGTLKGGAPDSKLALKASSRSCSFMSPPRVTAEALVSKFASAGLCRDECGQALRDDLARLRDQLTNNLAGRLDLVNQAQALTRQEIHRIDIACGISIRWESHEPQHGHGLAADHRPADHRLVRAGFLTTPLLAEPLLHECRLQGSVRGVRPAVTKKDSPNGVLLVRLHHHLPSACSAGGRAIRCWPETSCPTLQLARRVQGWRPDLGRPRCRPRPRPAEGRRHPRSGEPKLTSRPLRPHGHLPRLPVR